ncbi:hypothetical protein NDU88_009408 [Pleurodeles waltl]|uniref:Uncharacterized protein n=1 Tax=Pleurodeles waltl TaxID=8319 RepID=A0AAV7QRG4_PLEWA|nr:hypothetical protein NDU88_009408 [Pleurodeles waltl]
MHRGASSPCLVSWQQRRWSQDRRGPVRSPSLMRPLGSVEAVAGIAGWESLQFPNCTDVEDMITVDGKEACHPDVALRHTARS